MPRGTGYGRRRRSFGRSRRGRRSFGRRRGSRRGRSGGSRLLRIGYRMQPMRCIRPFRYEFGEYGCGQCMPCRINRKRLWTGRLLLESTLHRHSCFVTLTYDETHLPKDNSLSVPHYQQFIKRLRRVTNKKIVYYIVGEYGDTTVRPHYHAIIFGKDWLEGSIPIDEKMYTHPDLVKKWGNGMVSIAPVTMASICYTCGYVTKKMDDPDTFNLMSRRPGRS